MYTLLRSLLFLLEPETAHMVSLKALQFIPPTCFPVIKPDPVTVMGLPFAHRIGLAAGFDKNAEYLNRLAKLGFAFIEVGTVTPRPQTGNPKPRLFRLPKARALINRMGFNNVGVDQLIQNIEQADYRGILGVNIGKNKDTPLNKAAQDYLYCLERVYLHADYITINLSSPNTPELRQLQQGDYFEDLIRLLQTKKQCLREKHARDVPLVVKLSPDESDDTLKQMADVMLEHQIDGIIATNTTCSRTEVRGQPFAEEVGGLSGAPLFERATNTLQLIKQMVGDSIALIGVGGIDGQETARKKLQAGASLLQVYTGLIYKGPKILDY